MIDKVRKNPFGLKNNQKGAGLVEYGIVVGLISLLAIASVFGTGTEVKTVFCRVTDKLNYEFSEIGFMERVEYSCSEGTQDPEPTIPGAPIAVTDTGTAQGQQIIIPVLDNDSDPDGDTLTVTAVTAPGNGTATINGDNTITYNPDIGYEGSDTFTYTISDGALTDTANVDVSVTLGGGEQPFTAPSNAGVYASGHLFKDVGRVRYTIVTDNPGETIDFKFYVTGSNDLTKLLVSETLTLTNTETSYTVDLDQLTSNPEAPNFDHQYGRYGYFYARVNGSTKTESVFINVEDDILISSPLQYLHNDNNNGEYEHYYDMGSASIVETEHGNIIWAGVNDTLYKVNPSNGTIAERLIQNNSDVDYQIAIAPNGDVYTERGHYISGGSVNGSADPGRSIHYDEKSDYVYMTDFSIGSSWVEVWNTTLTTQIARSMTYDGTNSHSDLLGARGTAEGPNHFAVWDDDLDHFLIYDKGRTNMVGDMDFQPSRVISPKDDLGNDVTTSGHSSMNDDTLFYYTGGVIYAYNANSSSGNPIWSHDVGSLLNSGTDGYHDTGVLATNSTLYLPIEAAGFAHEHAYRPYNANTGVAGADIEPDDKDLVGNWGANVPNRNSFMDPNGNIWSSFPNSGTGSVAPYDIPNSGIYWVKTTP